jgi:transposase-like protein
MRKNQKFTKEQMYALIREWERSGLSQERFFKQHRVPRSTFAYWRKKYLREASLGERKDTFIPVKVDHTTESNPDLLQVIYPNGIRLVCSPGMDLSRLKPLIVL